MRANIVWPVGDEFEQTKGTEMTVEGCCRSARVPWKSESDGERLES
jgi:hypothetical protein